MPLRLIRPNEHYRTPGVSLTTPISPPSLSFLCPADFFNSPVILTPDDMAYCTAKDEGPDHARPRARQNVVFEFGYFVKWSRKRTVCLYKTGCNLDLPTDVQGLHYLAFKDSVTEARDLLKKELEAARILESEPGAMC
ncbi:MAG: hypothetical protein HPY55_04365 [Firmicutes bacterium]|nr:hypothetical protein [Bacillota bacterium]